MAHFFKKKEKYKTIKRMVKANYHSRLANYYKGSFLCFNWGLFGLQQILPTYNYFTTFKRFH